MSESGLALIDRLGLQPHPEGGWFRRTFESAAMLEAGQRCGSAIYYLLCAGEFSAFHRLQSDEMLHHYAGAPVRVYVLAEEALREITLGPDVLAGEQPQLLMPAGTLFAIEPVGEEYALLGCTVCPEFRYEGWGMPGRSELIARYPQRAALIRRLTRE